jgi:hypothetical protein
MPITSTALELRYYDSCDWGNALDARTAGYRSISITEYTEYSGRVVDEPT